MYCWVHSSILYYVSEAIMEDFCLFSLGGVFLRIERKEGVAVQRPGVCGAALRGGRGPREARQRQDEGICRPLLMSTKNYVFEP